MLSKYGHGDTELLKLSAIMSVLQSNSASAADDDDPNKSFLYLDPKQHGSAAPQRRTAPFDDAVLFVVGGGNYTEYQNVTSHATALGRRIIYGTSELIAPSQFLAQLHKLGSKQRAADPAKHK